jgi:Protein of unknown function (DUF1761)
MEYLNVIAAAIGAFAFGAVWYIAMSKAWIKAAGIAVDAQGRPEGNGSALPFVIGFVAMLVVAGTMRHLFAFGGIDTIGEGIGTGAGIGAFFISAWVAMNYGFAMRPLALWLIDSVNAIVGCAIMGAILVLF